MAELMIQLVFITMVALVLINVLVLRWIFKITRIVELLTNIKDALEKKGSGNYVEAVDLRADWTRPRK